MSPSAVPAALLQLLDDTLGLKGRALGFDAATPLLGALPELDSMAVVGVLTALEEHFGLVLEDERIDGSAFATVGSLAGWIASRQAA